MRAFLIGFLSGLAAAGAMWLWMESDVRQLGALWRDAPDEDLRPWFRTLRRVVGGRRGPKGGGGAGEE